MSGVFFQGFQHFQGIHRVLIFPTMMLRKRYGDIISAKALLSSLVTIDLPLPARIFNALRSLWNHPLACNFSFLL
jgi:hypothetical protein